MSRRPSTETRARVLAAREGKAATECPYMTHTVDHANWMSGFSMERRRLAR